MTRLVKTYHLHKKTHKLQVTNSLVLNCSLMYTSDKSAKNTFNYQNDCRNKFGELVTQRHRSAKSEILIISLRCRL